MDLVWTTEIPAVGGKYWVTATKGSGPEFALAVGLTIRDVRIVDYGGGDKRCEVFMDRTGFRGEGWQMFGCPGAMYGPNKAFSLYFIGPLPVPDEPKD